MFVQVVTGRPLAHQTALQAWHNWLKEVGSRLPGWLGGTSGISPDGKFIALLRFEAITAGVFTSERPGEDKWWADVTRCFAEAPIVVDSSEVDVAMTGSPEEASSVQFVLARTRNPARVRRLNARLKPLVARHHPDVIGNIVAWHSNGDMTEAVYFAPAGSATKRDGALPDTELEELEELDRAWFSALDDVEFIAIG